MVGTWRWPLAGIALITIAAIVNNVLFTNVNLLTGRDPLATLSDLDRRISSPPVLSLATVRNPVLWASLSVWLPVLFSSGRRFTHTVLNKSALELDVMSSGSDDQELLAFFIADVQSASLGVLMRAHVANNAWTRLLPRLSWLAGSIASSTKYDALVVATTHDRAGYVEGVTISARDMIIDDLGVDRLTAHHEVRGDLHAHISMYGDGNGLISVKKAIPLSTAPSDLLTSNVRITFKGVLERPALTLRFDLAWHRHGLTFDVRSDWDPSSTHLMLQGTLKGASAAIENLIVLRTADLRASLMIDPPTHRLAKYVRLSGYADIPRASASSVAFTGVIEDGTHLGVSLSVKIVPSAIISRASRPFRSVLNLLDECDATLDVATDDINGEFAKGVRLTADTMFTPRPGSLFRALAGSPIAVRMTLTSSNSLTLSASGSVDIHQYATLTKLVIDVTDEGALVMLSAFLRVRIASASWWDPIRLEASWKVGARDDALELRGTITDGQTCLSPHLPWLHISSATVTAVLSQERHLEHLSATGSAKIAKTTASMSFMFSAAAGTLRQYSVTLATSDLRCIVDLVLESLDRPVPHDSTVDDLDVVSTSVTVTVDAQGVSIEVDLAVARPETPTHRSIGTFAGSSHAIRFGVRVKVPFANMAPSVVQLTTLTSIPLSDSVTVYDATLQVDLYRAQQPSIDVSCGVGIHAYLARNVSFEIIAEGALDGFDTLTLSGGAVSPSVAAGQLVDLAGLRFDDLYVRLVISGGMLSAVGGGLKLQLGRVVSEVDVLLDAQPAIGTFLPAFLYGNAESTTLRDLALSYNDANDDRRIDVDQVPSGWSFGQVMLRIAPQPADIVIDGHTMVKFDRGLAFEADMTLMGIVGVSVGAVVNLGPSKFDWHVHCNVGRVSEHDWLRSIGHGDKARSLSRGASALSSWVPVLVAFSVDRLTTANIAAGIDPAVTFTFLVFRREVQFTITLPLHALLLPFHMLIARGHVHLHSCLQLPEGTCVVSSDCPHSGDVCVHSDGSWTCRPGCSAASFDFGTFGCIETARV
ncbi:EGF-like domain-containing protein [Plasmodiophora brassicae]